MTETRFTWRWLFVIAFLGIVMGLALGLLAGWIVFPNLGSSNISGLSASAQNDYIILVANTYAYDQDDAQAKQRLKQLQDSDIKTRLERLAKSLAARKDPSAANVADLAVALGSTDSSLQVLAATISSPSEQQPADNNDTEPTKVAVSDAEVTPTVDEASVQATADAAATPTDAPKKKKTKAAPTSEPTDVPPTKVPVTRAPTVTPPPPPPASAPVTTEFHPDFPALWWDAVKFNPAQVAPGQQYWHLKFAKYCDWSPDDQHQTCPGWPGGGMDHSIYIMTVDENGGCVTTEVTDIQNDGTKFPLTPDALKTIAYAWNPYNFSCNKDYEKAMYGEGNDISVPGLPSDQITELSLCSKTQPPGKNPPPCGHAHVRYFLIFQRTTN